MNYEIIDNNGVVYSGTEEEMTQKFDEILNGEADVAWVGDLKLVHVLNVTR